MTSQLELPIDDIAGPLSLPSDRSVLTPDQVAERTLAGREPFHVVGAEGAAPALLACALARPDRPVLYLVPDTDAAVRAAADLSFVTRILQRRAGTEPGLPPAPLLLTAPESSPYAEAHADRRAAMTRTGTLFHLAARLPFQFLVATAPAILRRVVNPAVLLDAALELAPESEIDVARIAAALTAAGYLRVPVVEDPGSFAVRGGILDVWPAAAELPVRAELYGDLVLTLRTFDPEDQKSLDDVPHVWLPPAREAIITEQSERRARQVLRNLCDGVNLPSTKARGFVEDVSTGRTYFGLEGFLPAFADLVPIFRYLPENAAVLVEDATGVLRAFESERERAEQGLASQREAPHFSILELYVEDGELTAELGRRHVACAHRSGVSGTAHDPGLAKLEEVPIDAPSLGMRDQSDLERAVKLTRGTSGKHTALDPLVQRLAAWQEAGLRTVIAARVATQAERVAALLSHRGVRVASADDSAPNRIQVLTGTLARGVIAPSLGLALVTEEEIFGHRAHRPRERKRSPKAFLEDLRALTPGDYVVHVEHGIGRYLGLERKLIGNVGVELLAVEYVGGKLFLPVYRMNQIQKYSGGEAAPKLDRLGGVSFAKTKAKVERRVRQLADELLRLYAERAALVKEPLPPADDDYAAFEATFPFEETRDQALAITEVAREMESTKVMDRLVCGDVGFGKTEVALRAAFRNALAGRQVALLCPTTVLAQQHFLTFTNRLAEYPITVRALSRFESKKEQQDTLKGLKEGSIDIVIGTHRLLSKDVHFKKLGLLVVDEEHRFGVTHKERIKQLRSSVDVLTLSATPIPRTLQMAVGGLRDMSIITTPPVDRRAVRTITARFDEQLIREAVERELSRGGQVFYVYNRVEGIYEKAAFLQNLLPQARIAVGHGQLGEAELERTMLDFVAGQYDILVATAIIESGLDIPRANTMIIDRADLFGLAQLYQLRGRVGRASERAYCYLLVPPPSQLTEEARSRIEALERYTELGSGFHIASLDMELRGAGDVLGSEQSGFVASIGFDLFCHMLEEATHELRGEPVVHEVDPELSFDVEALLPEDYVAEVGVRLSLYKRLASASDEAEVADLAAEMQDRFGPPPLEARRLVELMRLKTELRRLRVLGCEASARSVTLHLRQDTPLDRARISALVSAKKSAYRLTPDGRLTRRALETETFPDGLGLADRMLSELAQK